MFDINSPITITRNGVDKVLSKYKIVKGKKEGKEYLAPTFSIESWDADSVWVGAANLVSVVQKFAKVAFQDLWFGAIDPATGEFNMPQFMKQAEEFTSSGMKLSEINEQLDEAQAKQGLLIATAETDDATGMFKNASDIAAIKDINNTIIALRAMRDARSRKGKEDEAAEPSVATA
jgi:hypothetical protein